MSSDLWGSFCKSKFLITTTTSIVTPLVGILILIVSFTIPSIDANGEAIQENAINIGVTKSNTENLADSLDKLDDTISRLEQRLDKMNLIMCDISSGKHC